MLCCQSFIDANESKFLTRRSCTPPTCSGGLCPSHFFHENATDGPQAAATNFVVEFLLCFFFGLRQVDGHVKPAEEKTILDEILVSVMGELEAARRARPLADLRARLRDVPPVRPVRPALEGRFSLLAEIKTTSPSVGKMREANVRDAAAVYEDRPVVTMVSILTNMTHFGQDIFTLQKLRGSLTKPVLRKDFIIDEYQIREARAFGADAILLMASVLDASRLRGFYDLARELDLEVLFEVHDPAEIAMLPTDAALVGINSRKFKSREGFTMGQADSGRDFSIDLAAFDLVDQLPEGVIRVAESGLSAANLHVVTGRFEAALVGTSLLRDERGIEAAVLDFERALAESEAQE